MEDNHNISDELLASFLDGNVNEEEMARVLTSAISDREIRETLSISRTIEKEESLTENKILPMAALAAANRQNLCSFDCEVFILQHLDYDIDHWSLLETAKANNWLKEEGTPLLHVGRLLELKGLNVVRSYESSIKDIETAHQEGREAIVVVDKNIISKNSDGESTSLHAIYVTSAEDDGVIMFLNLDTLLEEIIEKEDFLKAWAKSGYYLVTASNKPNGYNPQPISVEDIDLSADLEDLTEAIAENAHDIWARARMDEGWTYGPKRDDVRKRHPDLVPYAQLPESEKEYDRIMAMNTLRLVHRLGYIIVNCINS